MACVALCFTACCDVNPVDPDPCEGAERVKARFTIYELVGKSVAATDTIIGVYNARFSADERYDSYEWSIGSDTRTWTDSSFDLRFRLSEVGEGVPLPIRFIGKRAPKVECFPDDDGVDTTYRELVVLSMYKSPVQGSYRGYHVDEPLDTFTVDIYWKTEDFLVMRNINRGCMDTSTKLFSIVSKDMGATIMEFDGLGGYDKSGCMNPKGVLRLFEGNRVEINYVYDKPRIPKLFIGWRVP